MFNFFKKEVSKPSVQFLMAYSFGSFGVVLSTMLTIVGNHHTEFPVEFGETLDLSDNEYSGLYCAFALSLSSTMLLATKFGYDALNSKAADDLSDNDLSDDDLSDDDLSDDDLSDDDLSDDDFRDLNEFDQPRLN